MDLFSLFHPSSFTCELLTDFLSQRDFTDLSYTNRAFRVTLVCPAPWSLLFPAYIALGYYQTDRPAEPGSGDEDSDG